MDENASAAFAISTKTFSMLAMLLYVRNSPHMPIRAQKSIWFLLLLPILAMVSRLAWAQ